MRLSHDQFKFHLCDKTGCEQYCRILERLARIELLELDSAVQIQKMWRGMKGRERYVEWWAWLWNDRECAAEKIQCVWRGMKGRERYVEWWAHRWWGRECAAVKIQCVWRGVLTRNGKTPNSWWIKALCRWNKQVCCPHRSMVWIHPPEAGPPL